MKTIKSSIAVLAISVILAFPISLRSQTVSMDFTRTDCDGVEHNLYSELDAGKVVILDFVMLGCSSCIVATDALKQIAEPYDQSHPGRVLLYEFGYIKNYTCEQLKNWQTQYHLRGTVFEDGSSQVGYYNGMGMPTIVVTGTNNHNVLYRKLGYTPSDNDVIIAAVNQGLLYAPQGIKDDLTSKGISIFPTFFTEQFYVTNSEYRNISLSVYDIRGKKVVYQEIDNIQTASVNTTLLKPGIYSIVVATDDGILGSMKVIKK